mmetsp:Transcript_65652/g.130037  ORF Transcript_65652/g.130037 Transcript_65652/m.130037 type:complete len:88 (+) Transcript_65652:200-463(+)
MVLTLIYIFCAGDVRFSHLDLQTYMRNTDAAVLIDSTDARAQQGVGTYMASNTPASLSGLASRGTQSFIFSSCHRVKRHRAQTATSA